MKSIQKTLVLVDGLNLLCDFASFDIEKACKGALNEILSTLLYLDGDFGTPLSRTECVFVWDSVRGVGDELFESTRPSYRKAVFADYKANRAVKQSFISYTIENWRQIEPLLFQHGIKSVFQIPLEADDYISFIAHIEYHRKVVIVSNDSDFLQLVSPRVTVMRSSGRVAIDNFAAVTGFPTPFNFLQHKAAGGDQSDNIPAAMPKHAARPWAISGGCVSALSPFERRTYMRNLNLTRLTLWTNTRAVHPHAWADASRKFYEALASVPETGVMTADELQVELDELLSAATRCLNSENTQIL